MNCENVARGEKSPTHRTQPMKPTNPVKTAQKSYKYSGKGWFYIVDQAIYETTPGRCSGGDTSRHHCDIFIIAVISWIFYLHFLKMESSLETPLKEDIQYVALEANFADSPQSVITSGYQGTNLTQIKYFSIFSEKRKLLSPSIPTTAKLRPWLASSSPRCDLNHSRTPILSCRGDWETSKASCHPK